MAQNALARIDERQLAEVPRSSVAATPEELKLIRQTYAKDLTEEEFALLVADARHRDLDIVKREIIAIKHRGQMTTMPTIHGIRKLAERSGQYAGSEGPFWCGPDGHWLEVWLDDKNPPAAAKFVAYRHDSRYPVVGIATWKERSQWYIRDGKSYLMPTWAAMPAHMLGKVAETDALKRARLVPDDLLVSLDDDARAAKVGALRYLHKVGAERGIEHEQLRAIVSAVKPGTTSMGDDDVTSRDLSAAAELIESLDESAIQAIIESGNIDGEIIDAATGEVIHADDAETTDGEVVSEPENERDRFRRHFFKAAKERGITDKDKLKALCTHIFPSVESRASYTASMWADAVAWIEDQANAAALVPFKDRDWLAEIGRCTSAADLMQLAGALRDSGQGTDALRAAFRQRSDELVADQRLTKQ